MKLLIALAAGVLGYCYKRGLEARARKGSLKEEVTRWEGEGGNVPSVAAPSPTMPPAFRGDGADVRH
ncbi:MAG TPA: hypothetical protein VEC19_03505 [Usitatibacter sp.]|nr:hypothetical protein [Usitatibacter sp.]